MGLQLKSQMRARLHLSALKVKRWEKFTEIMGFFVSSEGWQWYVDGTQAPALSSEAAALVCRLYAIAEYTWLMFLPTDLTFSSRLLRDTEPTKKQILFFLFTSRWLCLVCCIRTCSSPPIATLSAGKQRWGSTQLAAIATRQRFGLRVMNIFWWSAAWLLTVSGKNFCQFCIGYNTHLIFEDSPYHHRCHERSSSQR